MQEKPGMRRQILRNRRIQKKLEKKSELVRQLRGGRAKLPNAPLEHLLPIYRETDCGEGKNVLRSTTHSRRSNTAKPKPVLP